MSADSWPAPAKINLFLHIVGRREDGYHLLQSVFQFLDIMDSLEFNVRDDTRILRHASYNNVTEEGDLAVKAAKILRKHTGTAFGVDIYIHKKIPLGGGLGGGSSDAATTLVALNAILGLRLSVDELAGIGLQLGADVPVFVRCHAAWAEGVGEKLTPVSPAEDWYLVVVPDCQVATAEIFSAADLTRNTPAITIRDFLAGSGGNDCEKVVRRLYPEVAEVLDWLDPRYQRRMTGTGACVYARFTTPDQAREAFRALPHKWQGFVAQGLNVSPLAARLSRG